MDFNVVVLSGKLTAPPEIRRLETGSSLVRCLITVRSARPRRRVDVVPVTLWDPPSDHEIFKATVAESVWAAGSVQRRFWETEGERQSRLEVVASHIEIGSHLGFDGSAVTAGLLAE